jgi:hypothetical protein
MSTSPLQQIPSTAVDVAGLSVSTLIKSPTDPRPGHIYDSTNLAAAVPIHFHPTTNPSMGGNNYLMLNSQRWTSAMVSTTNPGAYTAYTPISVPNWVQVNAATGARTTINSGFEIPMTTPNTSRTLTAASSRGTDLFWTLNSVVNGSETSAVVQQWHNNTVINTINLRGEETIPQGTNGSDTVNFSAGLQWSSTTAPYMYFYGTGSSTHQVYMARKSWSRVGHTGTPTRPLDTQWEFFNGRGWVTDATALQPIQTASGPLVSVGPLSFGHYGMTRAQSGMRNNAVGYNFMSTVQASGTARSAQIYSSLGGRSWQTVGSPISLGTAGSTYMGGTLQLNGHVGPNPDMVTGATALPYCYTLMQTSGGASSLQVNWGLLQVPQLS